MEGDTRSRMAADGAADVRPVEVPSWGTVYVRDVTVAERARLVSRAKEALGTLDDIAPNALLAAVVLCEADGTRSFDPTKREDLDFLASRRDEDVDRVIAAASADRGNSTSASS